MTAVGASHGQICPDKETKGRQKIKESLSMIGGANNTLKRERRKTVQRHQICPSQKMRGLQLSQPGTNWQSAERWFEFFKRSGDPA